MSWLTSWLPYKANQATGIPDYSQWLQQLNECQTHSAINCAKERKKKYPGRREDAIHLSSAAPSCPLAWPSPRTRTSSRKWDEWTEEQEEDFRPKAQFFTVKSCFVCPLSVKADGGRPSHHQTPRSTAQHAWALGCPQQRGGGHPSCMRWLFLNLDQLRSFTQRGRHWTRPINDKNTCLFLKFIFSSKWITTSCPSLSPPVKT